MTTLTGLAFALYLAAAACYGAILFLRAPISPGASSVVTLPTVSRLGRPLLLAGILTQFVAVGAWCVTVHRSPFASEFGTLSILAWVIALTYALLDFRVRIPSVGAVALSLACIVLFWGVLHVNGPVAATPLLKGRIVSLHVLTILLSFGLFALAFGCAALYLLQNRLLKEHNVRGLFRRLPSLEVLDTVGYHAVAYGLPLLTLGLALGALYAVHDVPTKPLAVWFLDPRGALSLIIWVLYVLYLTARLAAGWRGVRLQYILLMGLVIALGLYIVPTSTHHFS